MSLLPRNSSCGRCVFSVLIPLAIATATILVSTIMMGLSADEANESHRLERDAVWDIPVMDTLRLWKRSMGSVGSGKIKLEVAYENLEIQVGVDRYMGRVREEINNTNYVQK
jgi:hypothetical protein